MPPTQSNGWHIWQALRKNAEFRLRVADAVQRAFFHKGPLTAEAATTRFRKRAQEIDRAIVGESNRGFLELLGAAPDGGVVSAENSDREQVYAEIARQTGTSPDAVGRARARKIAENSRPGVWLQRESGEWYRK